MANSQNIYSEKNNAWRFCYLFRYLLWNKQIMYVEQSFKWKKN